MTEAYMLLSKRFGDIGGKVLTPFLHDVIVYSVQSEAVRALNDQFVKHKSEANSDHRVLHPQWVDELRHHYLIGTSVYFIKTVELR